MSQLFSTNKSFGMNQGTSYIIVSSRNKILHDIKMKTCSWEAQMRLTSSLYTRGRQPFRHDVPFFIFLVNHCAPAHCTPPQRSNFSWTTAIQCDHTEHHCGCGRLGQYIKTVQFNHSSILIHTHHSHTEIRDHIQKLINVLPVLPRDFY